MDHARTLSMALLMLFIAAGFACTPDPHNNGTTDGDADTDTDTDADGDTDTLPVEATERLCVTTGGAWRTDWCGSHWPCGVAPTCAFDDDGNNLVSEGCDCGEDKLFDAATGCEASALCSALGCDNLAWLNASWGYYDGSGWANECSPPEDLGWAVVDGVCTLIRGCAVTNAPFPLFESRDACHLACDTTQELCMTTSGVWMIEPACDHYNCGVADIGSCAGEDRGIVCNCGPIKNWVDGAGCGADPSCPTPPTPGDCSSKAMDGIDLTLAPGGGACTGSQRPLFAYYEADGSMCGGSPPCCAMQIGCEDWVGDPKMYTTSTGCDNECFAGCSNDADCATGKICQFAQETNCGAWGTGLCKLPSAACAAIYDPVCGCNGVNVSSLCHLNAGSGNSLAYDGECFSFPTP